MKTTLGQYRVFLDDGILLFIADFDTEEEANHFCNQRPWQQYRIVDTKKAPEGASDGRDV